MRKLKDSIQQLGWNPPLDMRTRISEPLILNNSKLTNKSPQSLESAARKDRFEIHNQQVIIMKKLILLLVFSCSMSLLFGQAGTTVFYDDEFGPGGNLPFAGTVNGKFSYSGPANGATITISWSSANSRWEIDISPPGVGLTFVNTTETVSNPPDFNTGTWTNIAMDGTELEALSGDGTTNMPAPSCNDIVVNSILDNTTANDGNCTLREAILNANAGSDLTSGDCDCGTTITFDASTNGTTFVLTSDLPQITAGITMTGNGVTATKVDGADTHQL
jgi:CSLREA domain-containing protein